MARNEKRSSPTASAELSPGDLARLRQQLLDLKGQLQQRRAAIVRDVGGGLSGDSKERAVELENAEVLDGLGRGADSGLQAVNEALQRLDAGNYTECANCHETIAAERLRAFPQTSLCINCAR